MINFVFGFCHFAMRGSSLNACDFFGEYFFRLLHFFGDNKSGKFKNKQMDKSVGRNDAVPAVVYSPYSLS